MTRKRVGQGLVEAFSETCESCKGRGFLVQGEPVPEASEKQPERGGRRGRGGNSSGSNSGGASNSGNGNGSGGNNNSGNKGHDSAQAKADEEFLGETHSLDDREEARAAVKATLASIAAAAEKAHHVDEDGDAVTATVVAETAPQSDQTAEPTVFAEGSENNETIDTPAPAVESFNEADESAAKE
jgi:ribonuclease E